MYSWYVHCTCELARTYAILYMLPVNTYRKCLRKSILDAYFRSCWQNILLFPSIYTTYTNGTECKIDKNSTFTISIKLNYPKFILIDSRENHWDNNEYENFLTFSRISISIYACCVLNTFSLVYTYIYMQECACSAGSGWSLLIFIASFYWTQMSLLTAPRYGVFIWLLCDLSMAM